MSLKKFEELIVWQKSKDFSVDIYKKFKLCRDWSFKDQIQRASVSVMNNIAEGCEKRSDREFTHYLYISRASAGEVRAMLYLAKEIGYLDDSDSLSLLDRCYEISKMIFGLIKVNTSNLESSV